MSETDLRDVEVRLHDEERVERVRAARVRVIKKVFNLRKRRLAEPRAPILGRQHPPRSSHPVRPCARSVRAWPSRTSPGTEPVQPQGVLEPERLGRVREGGDDARVERLHLFEARGEELALRRGALVDADADEDLAEEREDARGVVEPGHDRRLPVRLREVCARRDAGAARRTGRRVRGGRGEGVVNSREHGGRGVTATHYSSSSSRGKLHVVSSSRRQIGRPRRMDMDLSAIGTSFRSATE